MPIIDQAEIDALLGAAVDAATATAAAPPPAPSRAPRKLPPELKRLMRIRVPVIVQLAQRMMPIAKVRDLSVGAIIEFERHVDDELDLLVNNRKIGKGTCVKAGESFGLRVASVVTPAARVAALGGEE